MTIFNTTSASKGDEQGDRLTPEEPLRERVRAKLEQLIIDGVLRPGDHLVEVDLAERLGVSRGPIREAFHQLHLAGWVDLRPRYGAFVHEPSDAEVAHFFDVRILLEVESARQAALHHAKADLSRLEAQISRAREALAHSDESYLGTASELFHSTVAGMAGNPVLGELVDLVGRRVRWYTKPMFLVQGEGAWQQHEELCRAIARGDADAAGESMRKHVESTRAAWQAARA